MTENSNQRRRPILGRLPAGLGAIAIALTSASLVVGGLIALRDPVTPSRYAVGTRSPAGGDTSQTNLSRDLARCRTVTDAQADPDCHAAWDAHRRRFFGSKTVTKPQER